MAQTAGTKAERGISGAQIKMIWGLARKADLDEDTLHAMVARMTGEKSIKALTSYQGKRVIDRLMITCGQEKTAQPGRATRDQAAKIRALSDRLGWAEDAQRLRGFMEKRYGVSSPFFMTDVDARNCIEAMKAMLAGGRGERRKKDADATGRTDAAAERLDR